MVKKVVTPSTSDNVALRHQPFAALEKLVGEIGKSATLEVSDSRTEIKPTKPQPPPKLHLRHETKGRSGKVVTRISGLPPENVEPIAARLAKALGCGATLDGNDVILLGMLAERAAAWLKCAGDLRKIAAEPSKPATAAVALSAATATANCPPSTAASPMKRSDIRPGMRVAIVMKADQSSGALTQGTVRDLLTNSPTHPRGIKVRLESGEVGRVKCFLDGLCSRPVHHA